MRNLASTFTSQGKWNDARISVGNKKGDTWWRTSMHPFDHGKYNENIRQ